MERCLISLVLFVIFGSLGMVLTMILGFLVASLFDWVSGER